MNDQLSICILTYNRASLLKITLTSFIEQVEKHDIPIYISDNCSDDSTEEVVLKCKENYKHIYYSRNSENLGFDGNLVKVVSLSKTKYCWLFGDDDIIVPGAIDKVLDRLSEDYGLVVVNASTYNETLSEQVNERHCLISSDRSYNTNDSDSAFTDLAVYTSFVGSMVIKRDLWNSINFDKYLKSGFVHVGIVFEYMRGKTAYFISEPLIWIRLGNSGWSRDAFRIWYVLWVSAINAIPSYSQKSKDKVAKPIGNISIPSMVLERAKGSYRIGVFSRYLSNNKDLSFSKKVSFFLIATLPVFIPKYLFTRYLNRKKPPLFEYQLFELNAKAKATKYI